MSLVKSPKEIVEEAEASGSAGLLSRHLSWERVEVGKIATIQNGAPFASTSFNSNKNGFPIIRIRDVGKNQISTWYEGEYSDDFIVRNGDLLIGMDGDFRSARWLGEPALLNQRVCRLIVKDGRILQTFIEFALPAYLDAIAAETSSITVKHLSSKSIQQIPLPLPPLAEQERIVEILEEQFSRLDSALASVKAVREKAKAFRRSLLHSAFSGELTGGTEGWQVTSVSKLGKWSTGRTPSTKVEGNFGGETPFATPADIDGVGKISDFKRFLTAQGVIEARLLAPMSVILVCIGATLGKVGWAEIPVTTNQQINALEPDTSTVSMKCAAYLFSSPLVQEALWQASSSTTLPLLNKSSLLAMDINLPPLAEQERIVSVLEEQFSRLDNALEVANQLEARIASERRSLLHSAFTGALTATWRETHV